MLLEDEQHIIRWLSQYGALPKSQLVHMLNKPSESTSQKILKRMIQRGEISDVGGGYYVGLDQTAKPEQRMIVSIWVLLQFIDQVEPLSHYPAVYPSQLFFLKGNTGYEIIVLYEGEEHLLRLLQPEDDLKYIIVLPRIDMASKLRLPKASCIFVTVDFRGGDEPDVSFYSEESEVSADGTA